MLPLWATVCSRLGLNYLILSQSIHPLNFSDFNYLVTAWYKFGRAFCKQTSVATCRFQNECNKVEIAVRVVFKILIGNQTCVYKSHSCFLINFIITPLISA